MNENITATVVLKLSQVPYEIKDVLLMVNSRDLAQSIQAGSCFIFSSEALYLTTDEKMILLAEFVKRLDISVSDLSAFLGRKWGVF